MNGEHGSKNRQSCRRPASQQRRLILGVLTQVAFQQFVDRNWEAVAAMYEDRHLLWGLALGARIVKRSVSVRRAKVRNDAFWILYPLVVLWPPPPHIIPVPQSFLWPSPALVNLDFYESTCCTSLFWFTYVYITYKHILLMFIFMCIF